MTTRRKPGNCINKRYGWCAQNGARLISGRVIAAFSFGGLLAISDATRLSLAANMQAVRSESPLPGLMHSGKRLNAM
jgi:hypothetical protein